MQVIILLDSRMHHDDVWATWWCVCLFLLISYMFVWPLLFFCFQRLKHGNCARKCLTSVSCFNLRGSLCPDMACFTDERMMYHDKINTSHWEPCVVWGPVDGRFLEWSVIDNMVWTDSWLSIAGAGCSLSGVGVDEEQAWKVVAGEAFRCGEDK
jgi:hypothetical protein